MRRIVCFLVLLGLLISVRAEAPRRVSSLGNRVGGIVLAGVLRGVMDACPGRYIPVCGGLVFDGHSVLPPMELSEKAPKAEPMLNCIRSIAAQAEIQTYCYYIERDTDLNLETAAPVGFGDWIGRELSLPEGHFDIFRVRTAADYCESFYRWDHHWNHRGSYKGYCEVLSMLRPGEMPLEPTAEEQVAESYIPSRVLSENAREFLAEPFYAYRFSYPELRFTLNGKAAGGYGLEHRWQAGEALKPISYGAFYGPDTGLAILEGPGRGRLLVFGESYDNAILKLLACHFEAVYAVDLRNYERLLGQPFHLEAFLKEHPADEILFIGTEPFFTSEAFLIQN